MPRRFRSSDGGEQVMKKYIILLAVVPLMVVLAAGFLAQMAILFVEEAWLPQR